MNIQEAAKEYADGQYEPTDRGILYGETQNDFVAGAEWQRSELILYWEGELKLWRSVSNNPLGFTNEQRSAAPHYCAAICVLLNQLKAK